MTHWFSAGTAQSFSYLSLLSLASVLQILVDRGRYRTMVTVVLAVGTGLGVTLLALAAIATVVGQPKYMVFVLTLCGVVIGGAFGGVLLSLRGHYTKAELRRIVAKDI